MTNEIGVVFSSDDKALVRDMKKRLELQDAEIAKLRAVTEAGRTAGRQLGGVYSETAKALAKLSHEAETTFKKTITPMEQHQQRMKEIRALYRLGKIDAEQLATAQQKSLKQYYSDSGLLDKLRRDKAEKAKIEKAEIDESLARQKAYEEDKEQTRRKGVLKSLALQKQEFIEGRRIGEAVQTAEEKHAARMERYNHLLQIGALSQKEFNRAVEASKKALDESGKSADLFLDRIKSFTIIGGIVGGATLMIRQLKAELDHMKEAQRNAGQTQKTYAQAQREALLNAGPDLTAKDLDKQVASIATETTATPTTVMNAVSTALSFKGGASQQDAIDAVRIAARQNPESPEALAENTKALLLLKQKNPKAKMESIAGFMIEAKRASPTVTDQDFSSTIAPGIANSAAFDADPRTSAALHGAVGSAIGDGDGRVTANALVNFQRQLKERLPQLKTFTERLHALQSDPRYQQERHLFLGSMEDESTHYEKSKLHAEAKAIAPLIDLIKGGNGTSELFEKNLKELPDIDKGAPTFEKTMKTIEDTPVQQNAADSRKLTVATELNQLDDLFGGAAGLDREGLEKFLQSIGSSKLSKGVLSSTFDAKTWWGGRVYGKDARIPRSEIRKILQQQEEKLRNPRFGSGSKAQDAFPVPEEDLKAADQIHRLLEMLGDVPGMQPLPPLQQFHQAIGGARANKPAAARPGVVNGELTTDIPHNAENAKLAPLQTPEGLQHALDRNTAALEKNTKVTAEASGAGGMRVELQMSGQGSGVQAAAPVRGAGLGPMGRGENNWPGERY